MEALVLNSEVMLLIFLATVLCSLVFFHSGSNSLASVAGSLVLLIACLWLSLFLFSRPYP